MSLPAARHFPFFDEPEFIQTAGKRQHRVGQQFGGRRVEFDYYAELLRMAAFAEMEREQRRRSLLPEVRKLATTEADNWLKDIMRNELDRQDVLEIALEI